LLTSEETGGKADSSIRKPRRRQNEKQYGTKTKQESCWFLDGDRRSNSIYREKTYRGEEEDILSRKSGLMKKKKKL